MKRVLFLLWGMLLCTSMVHAAPVSVTQARVIAQEFLSQKESRPLAPGQAPQYTLVHTAKAKDLQQVADYFVFNENSGNGYVVVAGDDRATAVLGYSDQGAFNPADVPDGLQYILDCYAQDMKYLRQHPGAQKAPARSARSHAVRPLMHSLWNQGTPYNDLCPTYTKDGTTYRAVTGCVATAAAQIMYYHKWPEHGTGSHSYECSVNKTDTKQLSADFEHTTYRWDQMLDSYDSNYTSAQANAVATLMYHIGVASEMGYGSTSGVSITNMMRALRDHFGYSKAMTYYSRSGYNITDWEKLLDNEIDNNRPVLYSGYTPSGGHAFVFDGYDRNGYYHVNWGWGGSSNGYFLLTALNPKEQGAGSYEGGYNIRQEIVVGIQPDQGEPEPEKWLKLACSHFGCADAQVNLGQPASMIMEGLSVFGQGYEPRVSVSLLFFLTDVNSQQLEDVTSANSKAYSLKTNVNYTFNENTNRTTYTPSTSLPNGDYFLWLMYYIYDSGMTSYEVYDHTDLVPGYIYARVRDGVMYFSEKPLPSGDLSLKNVDMPSQVGTECQFEVSATIHNNGDEYVGTVKYVISKNGQTVSTTEGSQVDVARNSDVLTKFTLLAPAQVGNYQLSVTDRDGKVIGGPYGLEVLESSNYNLSIATDLAVENYYMMPENVNATVSIKNTGTGNFVGPIQFMIIDENVTKVLSRGSSQIVKIAPGQTQKVNIHTYFEGMPGITYLICLRKTDSYTIWGKKVPFEIINMIVGDVNADNEVGIADLTMLVDLVLKHSSNRNSDVNGDGETSIADVTRLVSILLNQ
ncbi:MAG: C10 family peptidase [Muribaculaceae bacterium]|nr:C10 family peptidase [Muribaculaceae bacterium]